MVASVCKSKEEISFRRLLNKCESMVAERNGSNWRLPKYIDALSDRLDELHRMSVLRPSKDELMEYSKKVNFLKGILQVEKLETSSQKLIATELLSPVTSPSQVHFPQDKTREIKLQSKAKYSNEIRNELLGIRNTDNRDTSMLNRNSAAGGNLTKDEVEAVLKHHHDVQERVAEEMLAITRNLKENMLMANHIIKKDTECLEASSVLATKNSDNLRQSNDKVSEFLRQSCQYWLWIMLALVSLSFLWMVMFIRMFPKK